MGFFNSELIFWSYFLIFLCYFVFFLWILSISLKPLTKNGCENAATKPLSVLHLEKPYMFNCLTKDVYLECLKYIGKIYSWNRPIDTIHIAVPLLFHLMIDYSSGAYKMSINLCRKVAWCCLWELRFWEWSI